MEKAVKSRLQSVQFGEVQTFKNIAIVRIPVSCTEQGRWSYASKAFSESGNVMAYKSRSKKTRSVQCSLEESGVHHSSQGEVWHGIAELQAKAGASSATSAMSDIYKARDADLHQCDEIFESVPNQVGIFVMIDGRPAGVDMVSLIAFSVSAFSLVRFRPGPRKGSHPRRLLSPGRNRTTRANGFARSSSPPLHRINPSREMNPANDQMRCKCLPRALQQRRQTLPEITVVQNEERNIAHNCCAGQATRSSAALQERTRPLWAAHFAFQKSSKRYMLCYVVKCTAKYREPPPRAYVGQP